MATHIAFNVQGNNDRPYGVTVEASPDEVLQSWVAAGGLPFSLEQRNGRRVYINPATVTYWREVSQSVETVRLEAL